jgi:competence protein ComEC
MGARHLLTGVAGFVLGIFAQSLLSLSWMHVLYVLFLAVVVTTLFIWKRIPLYLLVVVFLVGGALGMARTELAATTLPPEFESLIGVETTIEGIVVADPDLRETSQRLVVELCNPTPCQGVTLTWAGDATTKVLVVAPLYPPVRYGESIRASGPLTRPEPFATDGGRTFAYDAFLAKDGIYAVMKNAQIENIGPRGGAYTRVRGALSDLKFAGVDALAAALPEPHASLAAGLILGGKQGLGEALLDDFIRSGLVHVVVLSGYNVMIVADFVMRLFGFLSHAWSASLGALTIGAFVLAAGAGPASIRAGIMAAIALYGRATGRTYEAFRALVFTGVLMLLWNPLTLPYDPGFQLSFIATLGLIFGAPLVERPLSFVKSRFLWEIASSTIAAQIAVLPLLLYQNGLFSLVALPANLLVLPSLPLAMLASFAAMLAGALAPVAAPVVGLPAYALLSYIIGAVELASDLPLAAFTVPAFPFALVVLAYALLAFYVAASSKRFSTTDQFRFERKAST